MADLANVLGAGLNLTEEQLNQLAANAAAWRDSELRQLAEDVARAKEGTRLTANGYELLGKAIAGKELRFTRIMVGDANGLTPTEEEQYEMNALIHPQFEAAITQVQHTGGGTMAVRCQVRNAEVTEGFRLAEIGLFALDPDTGEELMYCYRNSGVASDWMPSGDGAVLWDLVYTVITVIDKATNITAVIDGGLVYITQTEFLQHVASDNPHPNLPHLAEEITDVANSVWVNGGDNQLHPMPVSALGKQILGGDASNIPKMNSRLTQAEINLANIYLQLKSKEELGIEGNLLMIEPFTDKDCCDMYACKVIVAVAGVDDIQLETDKDILVGSWYTLTDGTNSELVQIKSVARNDTKVVAILEQNVIYTYNLNNTQLLRTTSTIGDQSAGGAGDIRATTLNFTETFTGTGGNAEQVLPLNTTQNNANNFTVTGGGTFTVDGYFTLSA
ncbi:MAG: hypothetical protein IKO74_02450 [Selenomonadaceae bacterium]|nr:hypothetical protein [Selenomonadaceae bacterium]